jgi:anti-sigma B factor antagonist
MTLRIAAVNDQVWTIAPRGRLDLPAARALEDALIDLCDAGRARVVVDLSEVAYVASAGLKALLSGLRRARLLNGDVRLAALDERVREVFEMAGFDQVFGIYSTPAEAVGSFA